MPSWTMVLTLFLLASISGLCWVLVLAQRQYEAATAPLESDGTRGLSGSVEQRLDALAARMAARAVVTPAPEISLVAGSLPQVATAAIEAANKVKPRNSTEARVGDAMRTALELALQGQFGEEVRSVVDGLDGVQSWHDIRKLTTDGLTIDHLAVGPRGVFVIDSVVRASKLRLGPDNVYCGRLPDGEPDPMLDEVLEKVAAVAALVEPAPVQGVIVMEDRLSLPAEIRESGTTVRGVHLVTLSQLPIRLTTGLPLAAALDVEAIWARLFPAFGPAIDSPDHPFAATVAERVPSIISVP